MLKSRIPSNCVGGTSIMEVSDGLAWIPGPISVVDCFFFCYFVALRLLQDVGLAVILLSLFNAASFFCEL
jgi:hypothetical protein